MLSKICLAISKYLFSLLTDYLLVKLISKEIIKVIEDCKYLTFIQTLSEVSLDFSYAAQTIAQIIEILLNTNAFTDKFRKLYHVQTQSANAMANKFDIKK